MVAKALGAFRSSLNEDGDEILSDGVLESAKA
jgi:hypothetical protein